MHWSVQFIFKVLLSAFAEVTSLFKSFISMLSDIASSEGLSRYSISISRLLWFLDSVLVNTFSLLALLWNYRLWLYCGLWLVSFPASFKNCSVRPSSSRVWQLCDRAFEKLRNLDVGMDFSSWILKNENQKPIRRFKKCSLRSCYLRMQQPLD